MSRADDFRRELDLCEDARSLYDLGLEMIKALSDTGESRVVRVGVAVLLRRGGGRVLMGRRLGSHGAGTWSFPGGHLERGENVKECASRELAEETRIEIEPEWFRKSTFTNDVFVSENKHYVTLYVEADFLASQRVEPKVMEPDKCAEWRWCDAAPGPLFLPIQNLLESGFEVWKKDAT